VNTHDRRAWNDRARLSFYLATDSQTVKGVALGRQAEVAYI
jgi:hypothetical protein